MSQIIQLIGVTDARIAISAARAGASHLSFIFAPKSSYTIRPEAAADIVTEVKQASEGQGFQLPAFAAAFADSAESLMAEVAPYVGHFQFHGRETAERIAALGAQFGVLTIKAIPVAGEHDIAAAADYAEAVDLLLFYPLASKTALKGGAGAALDFELLTAYSGGAGFLAGGLAPSNIGTAISALRGHTDFAGVSLSIAALEQVGDGAAERLEEVVNAARSAFG